MARSFYVQNTPIAPSIKFEEAQPEGYTLIGATDPMLDICIEKKYNEYALAGINYFKKARVSFVKAKMFSGLTSSDIIHIEKKLRDVESSLLNGNWASAQELLVNDVTVDEILSQGFYDALLNDFNEFIASKY